MSTPCGICCCHYRQPAPVNNLPRPRACKRHTGPAWRALSEEPVHGPSTRPFAMAWRRMRAPGPVPLPDTSRQAGFDFARADGMLGRFAALPS